MLDNAGEMIVGGRAGGDTRTSEPAPKSGGQPAPRVAARVTPTAASTEGPRGLSQKCRGQIRRPRDIHYQTTATKAWHVTASALHPTHWIVKIA